MIILGEELYDTVAHNIPVLFKQEEIKAQRAFFSCDVW